MEYKYRDNLGLKSDTTFGTEIEFEECEYDVVDYWIDQYNKEEALSKWKLTSDGTVMIYRRLMTALGGEAVSPIMTDKKKYYEELKKVCNIIKATGGINTEHSGGHVHVGAQTIKSTEALSNLLKIWMIYEKEIFHFTRAELPFNRLLISRNRYTSPISQFISDTVHFTAPDRERMLDSFYYQLEYGDTFKSDKSYSLRLSGFSSDTLQMDNTIEFRCPNGTLDPITWQNNINFFAKLCEKSNNLDTDFLNYKYDRYDKKNYNKKDYFNHNINDAIELMNLVFDKEIDKYYFLHQYGGEEAIKTYVKS